MGLFGAPTPYKNQKYSELKQQAKDSGQLFEDPEFPAEDKALFLSGGKLAGIEWKRPKDICENPKLFVEGVSGNDLNQGEVGNCWFVAACSCLAQKKEIWSKIIPDRHEQEWQDDKPEEYQGVFHFVFWRFGQWLDVVIDDRLPTRNGKLVFVHSKSKNEFWSALLEKAYAKLFGCYEHLDGGELAEALEDFTGGVSEPIDLVTENYDADAEKREQLYHSMKKDFENSALMAAAIPAASKEEMETSIDVGLVKGHAYGITCVKRAAVGGTGIFDIFKKEKIDMVRLRNPWGGTEWTGPFSDGSEEWNKIAKDDREKIGLTFDDDGEFWMTFDDFCKYFRSLAICRVLNTSLFSLQKQWHERSFDGEWKGTSAGGCANHKDTFLRNPQYLFDITEKEEEIQMSLLQKEARGEGATKDTIGFSIMEVEENRKYRVHRPQTIVKSSPFKNTRSVFLRHTLPRGRYVALPCTFEPGHEERFLLRLYTEASAHAKPLVKDQPKAGACSTMFGCCPSWVCCPCFPPLKRYVSWHHPVLVTRVKVIRAMALERQDVVGGGDPYCIISCEGQQYTSKVVPDTTNPEWNFTAVFYRRDPQRWPVKVNVWNKNPVKDEHMGRAVITALGEEDGKVHEVDLFGRKSKAAEKRPGKLYVQLTVSRNLQAL